MPPPIRTPPAQSWPHLELWTRVQEALRALPGYFESKIVIEGMLATDIHTLNAALGAAIEEQVVTTLNSMRALWDPERRYTPYTFVRQSQTFPDVLLRKKTNEGQDILFGIELKGWYLVAKEGMPNLRFCATRDACANPDLIVAVPWVLSNVLSGTPIVHPPYIELARYGAEFRNYHWTELRRTNTPVHITIPTDVRPYPQKTDRIEDKPAYDEGRNFGRLARTGMMDPFIKEALEKRLSGIEAREWLKFFKKFTDRQRNTIIVEE